MLDLEFGGFLNPEVSDYSSLLGDALLCEHLGFGSVWISDHLVGMYDDLGAARFESWTTSTALLVDTISVKVGQLVMANPFRPPPLMAKMGATLDSISGGRLILGLGTGWHEGGFKAYGYPFESPRDRVKRIDEAAIIIKRMWTEISPSFQGEFYSIEDAFCAPKLFRIPIHP